jgi:hypothetical protein
MGQQAFRTMKANGFHFPLLAKVLVAGHGVIAFVVFAWVLINTGGYQNGLRWIIIFYLDFPVFVPLEWMLELILPEGDSPFNPAQMPEMTLNCLVFGYTLMAGSLYWFMIGWLVNGIYQKLKRRLIEN